MYAIAIYDANLNGNKYVSKTAEYTIHNDKVQAFTFENARLALSRWYPNHTIIPFSDAKF